MEIVKSSAKEMASHPEAVDVVKKLIPYYMLPSDWFDYLDDTCSVWKVTNGDTVWGFYTLETDSLFGEGHAYIFPAFRSKSSRVLRYMIEHVGQLGLIPKTTATSDFPHVVKFLKMLGFTQMGVEKGGIEKSSGPVDVTYFMYFK